MELESYDMSKKYEISATDITRYKTLYHRDLFLSKINYKITKEKEELTRLYSIYERSFNHRHYLLQLKTYDELVLQKETDKSNIEFIDKETKTIEELAGSSCISKKLSLEECQGKISILKDKIKRMEELLDYAKENPTLVLPLE